MIDLVKTISGFLIQIFVLMLIYFGLRFGGRLKDFFKNLIPQIIGASIVFIGIRKNIAWLVYLGNVVIVADVVYVAAYNLLAQIRRDKPNTINKIFLCIFAPLQAMIRVNTLIIWFALISLISQKYIGVYIMIFFVLDVIFLAIVSIIKIIVDDMEYLRLVETSPRDTMFSRFALKVSHVLAFIMLTIFMGCALWGFVNVLTADKTPLDYSQIFILRDKTAR